MKTNTQHDSRVVDVLLGSARRNYTIQPTTGKSDREDVDQGRYSRRCTYHKIRHDIFVHSAYRISGRSLKLSYDRVDVSGEIVRHEHSLRCPEGWKWKVDGHGIAIARKGNEDVDYHPDFDEYHSAQFHPELVEQWIREAVDNHRKRELQRRTEEQFTALAKSVKVTIQDSLRAGNCRQGTLQFARNNGFLSDNEESDLYKGVRADVLLRFNGRAKSAVEAAMDRQCFVLGAGI